MDLASFFAIAFGLIGCITGIIGLVQAHHANEQASEQHRAMEDANALAHAANRFAMEANRTAREANEIAERVQSDTLDPSLVSWSIVTNGEHVPTCIRNNSADTAHQVQVSILFNGAQMGSHTCDEVAGPEDIPLELSPARDAILDEFRRQPLKVRGALGLDGGSTSRSRDSHEYTIRFQLTWLTALGHKRTKILDHTVRVTERHGQPEFKRPTTPA